eukprot:gnl/TRDRNA2_/TRDRNA2_180682_c0_seq1.p1 gnl/TRDRNA2_/TRDRNA2_180682_c0~~gnl/TRDRNA2_/TRDRNA2_180682_c0_seq1.p1  ORF type:complete len:181 (+),score=24.74 gnl/TRDRNA2_/TRDRNA2_180682_c0_seq1:103-645(+)
MAFWGQGGRRRRGFLTSAFQAACGPECQDPGCEPMQTSDGCWDMERTGQCPRGLSCKWCTGVGAGQQAAFGGAWDGSGGAWNGGGAWKYEGGGMGNVNVYGGGAKTTGSINPKGVGKGGGVRSHTVIQPAFDKKASAVPAEQKRGKGAKGDPDDPVCWSWRRKGECKAGDNCKYLHEIPE